VVSKPFVETHHYNGHNPIAVDDGSVYWASDGTLWKTSGRSGTSVQLSNGLGELTSIVAGQHELFVVDNRGHVGRLPKTGGTVVTFASFAHGRVRGRDFPPKLAIDNDTIWVCSFDGVYRLPLSK
jgi:hypothetical protein